MTYILIIALVILQSGISAGVGSLEIPTILQGTWFSWEDGEIIQSFIWSLHMDPWGSPLGYEQRRYDAHEYIFEAKNNCFVCRRFVMRSWNVVERIDGSCVHLKGSAEDVRFRSYEDLCPSQDRMGVVMFREEPRPINCRASVYGTYQFAWRNRYRFLGECDHPDATLSSCQFPGSQFAIQNSKFSLSFRKCPAIQGSFDAYMEFSCLGDWMVGKNQFTAVANLKESRLEEKYRCLVKNRDDPLFIGMSDAADYRKLRTPEDSPIRIRLTPLHRKIEANCFLPANMSGTWVSSGRGEPEVVINATHIMEVKWLGYRKYVDTYVCRQCKDTRFLMAKVPEDGCQDEYVCWDILPRHHNIIRFRKSMELTEEIFKVCDYANFNHGRHWIYDTLMANPPSPIRCPFSGRFTFNQSGANPLEARILGGITQAPLDAYRCRERVRDFSVCDRDQKWIVIDLNLCVSLNKDGHSRDFNGVADYRLQCVGYWMENLRSYLVTYDPTDPSSSFRCWVYQRVNEVEIRLSQGVGSACGLHQRHQSSEASEGASVALRLSMDERVHDRCPMSYDSGAFPWKEEEEALKIFRFASTAGMLRCSTPLHASACVSFVAVSFLCRGVALL